MTALPFSEVLTAARLHDTWLPTRVRLVREERESELRIRVHRAWKALEQAERIESDPDGQPRLDAALVFRWVALNALYGRWDEKKGMPTKDRLSVDLFTSEICRVDSDGRVLAALHALADDARELLQSPFLFTHFWQDPEWDQVRPNRRQASSFRNELLEGRPAAALHRVLMSVYFLRCQIVHGGATLGSSMNRVTVEPAARVLALLASQLVAVAIEHGVEMEWGPLCYPPVRDPETS